jgi:two-component system OmpR family sensor kinase
VKPPPPLRVSRWTLTTRLLLAMLSLLAAASLVIGVVSVLAMDRFLVGRLDQQLHNALGRSQTAFDHPAGERSTPQDRDLPDRLPGPDFLLAPGQSAGMLGAQLVNHKVTNAAVLDNSGTPRPLPPRLYHELTELTIGGPPRTDEMGLRGQYRLLAARVADGHVLVTGLPMGELDATVYRLGGVIAAVSLAGLAAAALAGAAIIRRALRPLHRVTATATQVAELPLDRGEVVLGVRVPRDDADPHTEVGQVGTALNRMLGHVADALAARQASEMRVRQFVADASHELRTPLAAIRGYAELTRSSRSAAPPEVAHALGRVEAEAVRMTALVDDLLLLARLDEGRPMERATVDLSRLLVDAVSDAHAAGLRHSWQLRLPDEPVLVAGDAARLHQVVANLLANARTHTPPGTTVRSELSTAAGQAVLSITDNGPGIPPEVRPAVFERFARGDSSRSRGAGGTGLGLAIVRAVVTAHGGSVEVSSVPGETTFTVRLPMAG